MNDELKNLYSNKFIMRVKSLPLFSGLDLKSSIVLSLGALAFFIMFIDLTSELACEKDEMSFVVSSLDNIDNTESSVFSIETLIPSIGDIIFLHNFCSFQTDVLDHHPDRAPPLFS